MTLRQLHQLYAQNDQDLEDSLDNRDVKPALKVVQPLQSTEYGKESLQLSRSEDIAPTPKSYNMKNNEQLNHL